MHFWIDKRSQTCGFGRARVAASLSSSGGVGLGFGHPPRRMGGKSLVAPIHRLQTECPRPHIHNNNNNNNNHNNNHSNNNNINNNNTSNRNNRNRNNANSQQHQQQQQQQQHYQQQQHQHNQLHESNHHQPGGLVSRHQNSPDNIFNNNLQRQNVTPANSQDCHAPVSLPQLYGGPSHAQELEQGSLGLGPMPTRPNLSGIGNTTGNVGIVDATDSQLLPSHLKCGMWASLVLASVFVAGAKFYFDHQGTGLEVLIFCAFSATFFLAACTVSLCRLPRDLASSPSPSVDGHSRGLDGQFHAGAHQNHSQLFSSPEQDINFNQQSAANSAPPPPYHIAILLPENTKDLQLDETPPPSYDKILI